MNAIVLPVHRGSRNFALISQFVEILAAADTAFRLRPPLCALAH